MKLTKPQTLIYDMDKFTGGAISVICGSMLIQGQCSVERIRYAVHEMYKKNEALRTRIKEIDGVPHQYVTEDIPGQIDILSFKSKAELDSYANEYAGMPMDITGELCSFKIILLEQQYGLLVKLHHVIGDAWTVALMGTQVNRLLQGEEIEAYNYSDYAEIEEKYEQSTRYQKDKAFFVEQFHKCEEVTYLSEKEIQKPISKRKSFVISQKDTARIQTYGKRKNISAYVLFMTVWAAYFSRIKYNAQQFYVGTAVLNRTGYKEKNTMGMYVNTVPVLMELFNDKSFAENLKSVTLSTMSVLRHQKYNYGDILKELRQEYHFNEKLYDVMLSYQNAKIMDSAEEIETTWYHSGEQNESLQIHIDDRDSEGIFRIHYDYQVEKFTEYEIEKMHNHVIRLLEDAMENEEKKLYELKMLTREEKKKLLHEFNDTKIEYPKDKCVHQLFEQQVAKIPDKTALIACDRTLTYAQLNEQANRIAHALIEKGVQVGDIVAFALPRKSYLIATMLGILKAGAVYLPIDPDYPKERINYMLEDSAAKVFITEDVIEGCLANENTYNPEVEITSDRLCYCIYTSGSTGKPKGTLISHKNAVNFASDNEVNLVHRVIKENDRKFVSLATVGFDMFVMESILVLLNGKEILFANEEQAKFQSQLNMFLKEHPADVMQTTPTKMKLLIADKKQVEYLEDIKVLIVGGEVVDKVLVKELQELTTAKIYNFYGPTEATVWATYKKIENSDDITIGKPIANTQIYIVDNYMNPTPIGVTGELCIAGDGVGAGYLNRPELTAEKFIDNPFGEGKMYKTGDLAYWREDGNIVYVGRNDFQVKIRGLRIELGEIESVISGMEGIQQSVIVVRKNKEGRQFICAFYTGEEKETKEIRSSIGQHLPKYMLPHIYTHMEKLPLTSSGKVNRKALPEISLEEIGQEVEYIPPHTKQQKVLCTIMEQVLGAGSIGLQDDFFDMGGDSLKAIEFVSKAHKEGIYFNMQQIFDYPTIGMLTEYMEQKEKPQVTYTEEDFEDIRELLAGNIWDTNTAQCTPPEKTEVGNLLLAGATGYLGIHILADFLEQDEGIVYCIVRGEDDWDSCERMKELLGFYFGDRYAAQLGHRIQVLCGDLQKEYLGLGKESYELLQAKVDTVINAAASVKHYGSYQYFYESNVKTTESLIAFCQHSGARLIHTSTLSVSGNSFADDFDAYISEEEKDFAENNLYIGQPLENVYARSKFEAERLVLEAMSQGLKANIMRMGNLTNRLDGKFQKNYESNAFLQRVKGVLDLHLFPDYLLDLYVEFTPIDEAARAVMTLTRHFDTKKNVFHINSTKVVYFDVLMDYLQQAGMEIQAVDGKIFTEALRQAGKQSGMEYIFETFIHDMDENEQLNYDSNIHIRNEFTEEYLRRLGFEWSVIDVDYIRRYVEYFQELGYFTVKAL